MQIHDPKSSQPAHYDRCIYVTALPSNSSADIYPQSRKTFEELRSRDWATLAEVLKDETVKAVVR